MKGHLNMCYAVITNLRHQHHKPTLLAAHRHGLGTKPERMGPGLRADPARRTWKGLLDAAVTVGGKAGA